MASESTETVTVRLPSELDNWLDEQARELGATRETVLVQMLASYRATAELDGNLDAAELEFGTPSDEALEEMVDSHIEARLGDRFDEQFVDELSRQVQSALTEQFDDLVQRRVDSAEREFQAKLEDVRERVVQVKQETDAKAPADHGHEELDHLVALDERVDALEAELDTLTGRLDATLPEQETAVGELEADVDQLQERLRTVAWTVRDLRDSVEADGGLDAVERVKRAAVKADVDRARCENCGNGVDIALLTDPHCPHCEATVADVEGANGFFSKPKLLVASQLESGEENE